MIRIIEVRQERGHQVCLVLDGAEDVRIDRRVWEESSCGIGSSLSEEGLEALLARSRRTRAKEKALFLLSRRDYSKKELFDRLSRERGRRHPERDEAAAETVQRMEELGLVDDEAYAARLAGEYIRRLYPRRRAVQELCGRGSAGSWRRRRWTGWVRRMPTSPLHCCEKNTIISSATPTAGAGLPQRWHGRAFRMRISAMRLRRRRRTSRRRTDRSRLPPGERRTNTWQNERARWAWCLWAARKTRWTPS